MLTEAENKIREEILSNKFLVRRIQEFKDIEGESAAMKKFLDDNPDFIQMMMNYASKIKIEDGEEGWLKV
ncbi:hypothetical protein LCGC14_1290580 [marine sediment metagenome]|uniref:Uncharacterized protein n=1 Tax=marine sediment metagenome TaxID=412755 RepID=A0A0F9NVJ8_9ZZZZ